MSDQISDFYFRALPLSDNKHPHNQRDAVGCKTRLGCPPSGLEKFFPTHLLICVTTAARHCEPAAGGTRNLF